MQITLTIADPNDATRLLNDLCSATKYDPGSGITKADWLKQQMALWLKQTAKRGEFKDTAAVISTAIDAINIQ